MKKLAWMLLLAILLCVCVPALAQTPRLESQTVLIREGKMDVVIYASTNENLQPADFTVMFGTTQAPVAAVSSLQRSDVHTTWLIVMDTYNSDGRETMKVLASELIDLIDENDNAAIMPTGTNVQGIRLTQDKSELLAAIDGIERNTDDTLNATIAAALDYLSGSQDALERTCLVVLSSDKTEGLGETYAELARKAEASRTTVYTASLNSSSASTENINEFSAIARTGHGSQAFEMFGFQNYKNDARDIAQQMIELTKSFRVLTIDLTGITAFDQKLNISMQDGSMQLSTSLELTAEEQRQMQADNVETTQAPATVPLDEGDAETGGEDAGEINGMESAEADTEVSDAEEEQNILEKYGLYIGVGAAVLLVLIIVLVSVSRRKKREEEPDIPQIRQAFTSVALPKEDEAHSNPQEQGKEERKPAAAPDAEEGILIKLEKLDGGDVYQARLINTLIVGRTAGRSDIVIPGDAKISGTHAEFSLRKGVIYVNDYQSKNGTKLNDTPVVAPALVHINDILTIGLTRLRIKW